MKSFSIIVHNLEAARARPRANEINKQIDGQQNEKATHTQREREPERIEKKKDAYNVLDLTTNKI